jgi:hypothetical protein
MTSSADNVRVSTKHHYIPEFHLKRWTGADGKLAVFQYQPVGLMARLKTPAQTGYEKNLYSSSAFKPEHQDILERAFMQPIDDMAAKVADLFITNQTTRTLTQAESDGWTRFLMSLIHRTPSGVATVQANFSEAFDSIPYEITDKDRADFEAIRRADGPQTIEEYMVAMRQTALEIGRVNSLRTLSDHPELGMLINTMPMTIVHLGPTQHDLLTSDRPLILSGGFKHDSTFMMLAISPRHLFVCAKTQGRLEEILAQVDSGKVVQENNFSVCHNAVKFVYGRRESQIDFVKKYFRPPSEIPDTRGW